MLMSWWLPVRSLTLKRMGLSQDFHREQGVLLNICLQQGISLRTWNPWELDQNQHYPNWYLHHQTSLSHQYSLCDHQYSLGDHQWSLCHHQYCFHNRNHGTEREQINQSTLIEWKSSQCGDLHVYSFREKMF